MHSTPVMAGNDLVIRTRGDFSLMGRHAITSVENCARCAVDRCDLERECYGDCVISRRDARLSTMRARDATRRRFVTSARAMRAHACAIAFMRAHERA
jgi:hypothetical protein